MRGTEDIPADDDTPSLVDSDSDDEASNVTAMDVSSAVQADTAAYDDPLARGAEVQENSRGTQDDDTRFPERLARFQRLLNKAKANDA